VTGKKSAMLPPAGQNLFIKRPAMIDTSKNFLLNKSFVGVQGAVFQKSPLVAEGILIWSVL
jgi:hypothetical protein